MGKRVLITGACGYIGSVLIPILEQHGHTCESVDTGFFRDCLLYPVEFKSPCHWTDVRDLDPSMLEGCDVCVHLAGISNDPFGNLDARQVYDPTREYSKAIAHECKKRAIRFIFASSCSIYGTATAPIVSESSQPNPQTPYSVNKLQIEEDLLALSEGAFNPVMLRFATIYGLSPRFRLDLVINMLSAMAISHGKIVLNSDGKAWRPHLHILDACQAIRCAIEQKEFAGPQILNVGRDEDNLTILEVARLISKLSENCPIEMLGKSDSVDSAFAEVVKDRKVPKGIDSRSYKVSFAKIQRELPAFKPQWNLEKGVKAIRAKLLKLGFARADFENPGYYRLQTIEQLFNSGSLNQELRWRTP